MQSETCFQFLFRPWILVSIDYSFYWSIGLLVSIGLQVNVNMEKDEYELQISYHEVFLR